MTYTVEQLVNQVNALKTALEKEKLINDELVKQVNMLKEESIDYCDGCGEGWSDASSSYLCGSDENYNTPACAIIERLKVEVNNERKLSTLVCTCDGGGSITHIRNDKKCTSGRPD